MRERGRGHIDCTPQRSRQHRANAYSHTRSNAAPQRTLSTAAAEQSTQHSSRAADKPAAAPQPHTARARVVQPKSSSSAAAPKPAVRQSRSNSVPTVSACARLVFLCDFLVCNEKGKIHHHPAMSERENNVYKAKLAEQAERYDGELLFARIST